jgi:hypothetical protein
MKKWIEVINRWKALSPETQQKIRCQRIPRQVALSMAFEGERLLGSSKLHAQAAAAAEQQ